MKVAAGPDSEMAMMSTIKVSFWRVQRAPRVLAMARLP